MTCASCVRNVERALKKPAGVLSVNVNLATEKATVTYLPGAARRPDLVKAVEAAGYGVLDLSGANKGEEIDAERAARQAEIDRQQRLVLIGAAFTLPLFILSMARDLVDGERQLCRPLRLADVVGLAARLLPAGDAGAGDRRQAVPRRRVEGAQEPHRQHGYADRDGVVGRLRLQRDRAARHDLRHARASASTSTSRRPP